MSSLNASAMNGRRFDSVHMATRRCRACGFAKDIVERRGCRPGMIVSDNGTELTSVTLAGGAWGAVASRQASRSRMVSWKASTAGSGMNATEHLFSSLPDHRRHGGSTTLNAHTRAVWVASPNQSASRLMRTLGATLRARKRCDRALPISTPCYTSHRAVGLSRASRRGTRACPSARPRAASRRFRHAQRSRPPWKLPRSV